MLRNLRLYTCLLLLLAAFSAGCKSDNPAPANASGSNAPADAGQLAHAATPTPSPTVLPRPSGPIEFTDVTAPAGIRFKHNSGAAGKKYLPETIGAGGAFLDYDNDGWQDIFLVNST
ncbi:MAG TPA: hypothetical protein VF634_04935, partial [Pyrinomonadaceae bacterium]